MDKIENAFVQLDSRKELTWEPLLFLGMAHLHKLDQINSTFSDILRAKDYLQKISIPYSYR